MKITALDLSVGDDLGLAPSKMGPLGDLVVLAGPNGAGKSRILALVKSLLSDPNLLDDSLADTKSLLQHHDTGGNLGYSEQQLRSWRAAIVRRNSFTIAGILQPESVLEFFPKLHALKDHRRLHELAQMSAKETIGQLGIRNLEQNTLAYLAVIERRAFAATHHQLQVPEETKVAAIADRDRLASLIEEFLGTKPALDIDQQPTLFGLAVPDAKLSHGQSLLLQVAVALHAQGGRLEGLVLLLDEPECHLHPAAVIEAIDRLRSLNKLGQIWIATHSIPVLASVPPESIWYAQKGGVSWAGRRPEAVLEGLLGGPKGRERMEEFLRLPAQFASNRFAAECLIAPSPVATGSDDPQAQQLREFCEAKSVRAERPLRVVDFGAGQGRLLSAMRERWSGNGEFGARIDYRAFEPEADESAQLRRIVDAAYAGDDQSRVFTSRDELSILNPHRLTWL